MPVLKNAKHERFAQAIIRGKSATESFVIAGYREHDGNAARLRGNDTVSNRINELAEKIAERTIVSVERLVNESARIALADITDVMEWKGRKLKLKSLDGLPPEITSAIAELRQTKDGVQVKFHDKMRAIELLARHKGMFKENVNLTVHVSLADLVLGSYADDLPQLPTPKLIEGTKE